MGILPSPRSLELGREEQPDMFNIPRETYAKFSSMFDGVDMNGSGFISGAQARPVLSSSGLPNSDLRKIWDLADAEKDGMLDRHEYVVCQFLIQHRLAGRELPNSLPAGLQAKAASPRPGVTLSVLGGLSNANSAPPSPMPRAASPPQVVQQAQPVMPMVLPTATPQLSAYGSPASERTSQAMSALGEHAAPMPSPMMMPIPRFLTRGVAVQMTLQAPQLPPPGPS